jgi:hypothetical protein
MTDGTDTVQAIFAEVIRFGFLVSCFYTSIFIILETVVLSVPKMRQIYLKKVELSANLAKQSFEMQSDNEKFIVPILGATFFTSVVPQVWLRQRRETEAENMPHFLCCLPPLSETALSLQLFFG